MFFSSQNNAFYPMELRGKYETAGSWPDDAVEVDYAIYAEFAGAPAPDGMHRVAGPDGLPMWEQLPPAPPYIPQFVTRRQGRLALLDAGKLDDVEAIIDAITDPIQKRAAQIEYEADTWERSNQFLQVVWSLLGGSEAELDALFIDAASR